MPLILSISWFLSITDGAGYVSSLSDIWRKWNTNTELKQQNNDTRFVIGLPEPQSGAAGYKGIQCK